MDRILTVFRYLSIPIFCLLAITPPLGIAADPAETQLLDTARELYLNRDFKSAFSLYREIARSGEGEALYYLGLLHAHDNQPDKAIDYYRQAAETNYTPAIRQLGYSYFNGEGVDPDPLAGLDWFRRAEEIEREQQKIESPVYLTSKEGTLETRPTHHIVAEWRQRAEMEEPEAQFRLAKMLDQGILVERSMDEAVQWYTAAAEHDHVEAQFILGYLYCRGAGVSQSIEEANDWLRRSGRTAVCTSTRGNST